MEPLNTAKLLYPLGADPDASNRNTPTIRIQGEGGSNGRYQVWVDGVDNGVWPTDMLARADVVCLPLSDGSHLFTFEELAPNPGKATEPYRFSVDTQAPPPPIITSVTHGVPDANGQYALVVSGTVATTGVYNIRFLANGRGVGGASPAAGKFSGPTIPLGPGQYNIVARGYDRAGNYSASAVFPITLGTVPPQPTVPGAGVAPSATTRVLTRQVSLSWSVPPDGGSPITGYRIQRNGVLFGSSVAPTYDDMTAPVTPTTYTWSAVNAVGEGPQSPAVTV